MPHPLLIDSFQTVPAFRELAAALPRAGESVTAAGLAGLLAISSGACTSFGTSAASVRWTA